MKKVLVFILSALPVVCLSQINIHDKENGIRSSIGLTGSSSKYGKEISQEVLDKFEIGRSTYAEVVKSIGKPSTELVDSSANLLMVVYVSQKASVDTNRVVLGAIPIFGALANQLVGRTEVKAETQRVAFVFNSDTKILIKISNDKSDGQSKDRTGLEIIRDTKISVGNEEKED